MGGTSSLSAQAEEDHRVRSGNVEYTERFVNAIEGNGDQYVEDADSMETNQSSQQVDVVEIRRQILEELVKDEKVALNTRLAEVKSRLKVAETIVPVNCADERKKVLECYRNSQDPLRCVSAVNAFSKCAREYNLS